MKHEHNIQILQTQRLQLFFLIYWCKLMTFTPLRKYFSRSSYRLCVWKLQSGKIASAFWINGGHAVSNRNQYYRLDWNMVHNRNGKLAIMQICLWWFNCVCSNSWVDFFCKDSDMFTIFEYDKFIDFDVCCTVNFKITN